jgi:hypothetical protein
METEINFQGQEEEDHDYDYDDGEDNVTKSMVSINTANQGDIFEAQDVKQYMIEVENAAPRKTPTLPVNYKE